VELEIIEKPENGWHEALASHLLFYAIPELPIFNYSTNLANVSGNMGTSPANTISPCLKIITNGYFNSGTNLKKSNATLVLFR
jgi:hypothetical protein